MIFAQVGLLDILVVLLYFFATAYLGWLGFRGTKSATDYLVAGRKAHPVIMALSYGATFISTSAIVGFGGVAGLFGMDLLWLTFCNIFIGIFIAFVFLGGPTRRMGHALDAHSFPELLGRRYQSNFVQVFAGLVIVLFMPLYGAAVLIGGTEFLQSTFKIDYDLALLIFALVVAVYVIFGGLKGVMYTDAFQGAIMFVGMMVLIGFTYVKLGGVTAGHQALTDLAPLTPGKLKAIGHQGWTAMPQFGFGDLKYDLWWIVISTIVMGVGIGVLAQPQLAVRFMTVKSKRELNRAVGVGGVFILAMTGVAFVVGSLSNAYFTQHGALLTGKVVKMLDEAKGQAVLHLARKTESGAWELLMDQTVAEGKTNLAPKVAPVVLDKKQPYLDQTVGADKLAQGRSISIVYAKGVTEQIIPTYINTAMPKWFNLVFMLTLLAAAMSTLSSQFHTLGTAAGRDVFEQVARRDQAAPDRTVYIVRIAIFLGFVVAVVLGHFFAKKDYIVARFTAIFFGLCATTFLPAFVGGLFWRRMTKAGAIASMLVGFSASAFWLLLVKEKEAGAIGLVQSLTAGKNSILWNHPNWPSVDPLFIGLPLSILTAVVVSLLTRPPEESHLAKCFGQPASGAGQAK